jgi:hypothetical protein
MSYIVPIGKCTAQWIDVCSVQIEKNYRDGAIKFSSYQMLQTVTLALWAASGFQGGAQCVYGLTSADP